MAKIAYLVSFNTTTRVVVDVEDESLENEFEYAKVVKSAREQMIENGIDEYLTGDNIDEIVKDEELPYPQNFD